MKNPAAWLIAISLVAVVGCAAGGLTPEQRAALTPQARMYEIADHYALTQAAASADLIVNCTSVGMSHGPDEHGSPLTAAQIPASAIVNDVVYNPLLTPILKEAATAGATALGGLHMLVYQGVLSFKMWTGVDAPVDVMLAAATAEMASRGA